jgi:hypothetical protein
MKHTILSLLFCFLLLSCDRNKTAVDDEITACGVSQPQKKLEWLVKLIDKANTDITGNYIGTIWLEEYNNQDFFVTNMGIGSGGLAYHVFDCTGNPVIIEDTEDFIQHLKKNIVLYSNIETN